eukprot:s206_g3.t1
MGSEAAQAAASGVFPTAVPWNQIPKFIPGETDVKVYARKLEFLRELWPEEALEQLAPRAALLVEGVAFQKVSRMDPLKLKSKDGVRHLVEALGGQWGRLANEERYDLFERALYATTQKGDESNDSYLARHDVAFEDLLAAKVTIEEVRAYVLVRQSVLQMEDRKKVILDSEGSLTYDKARKSMRLLGSKFFQDLQSNNKGTQKYKTYDVHQVEEEPVLYQEAEDDVDEEIWFQGLLEAGDEDASFIQDFEEQILTACQESAELASCFTSYQEARQRLRDKARSRGFWPLSTGKGKGKMKKGKSGAGFKGGAGSANFRRRSLADRIANSTCRRCGQPGHWRRECPMLTAATSGTTTLPSSTSKPESFTGILHDECNGIQSEFIGNTMSVDDVVEELPEGAVHYSEDGEKRDPVFCDCLVKCMGDGGDGCDIVCGLECSDCFVCVSQLSHSLTSRLMSCCRKYDACHASPAAEITPPSISPAAVKTETDGPIITAPVDIFATEEADDEAIIDTGASRAVIGCERLKRLVKSLPTDLRSKVMKVPTDGVVFKFGNAGRLTSSFAVMLPRSQNGWLRVEVVPGDTPFLISNAVLRGLKGVIDVEGCQLGFRDSDVTISLVPVRKNLMGVKIVELLRKAPRVQNAPTHILSAQSETSNETETHDTTYSCSVDGKIVAESHHMHEIQKHGRIQKPDLPKEDSVNVNQGMKSDQQCPTTASAAVDSDQGINTLTDWGRQKAPSGKHANRAFSDLYENERGYMNHLWNRRAVSTWVRSFQLYCRERRAASEENRRLHPKAEAMHKAAPAVPMREKEEIKTRAPSMPCSVPKGPSTSGVMPPDDGWINIPVETAVPEESKSVKRNMPSPSTSMASTPNPEKVAQLQAKIAILQRELDKETRGALEDNQD